MSEQRGTPDEQVQYWETMLQNYKARIAELEYALELVASGELMYPEQTARQALQEQEKK